MMKKAIYLGIFMLCFLFVGNVNAASPFSAINIYWINEDGQAMIMPESACATPAIREQVQGGDRILKDVNCLVSFFNQFVERDYVVNVSGEIAHVCKDTGPGEIMAVSLGEGDKRVVIQEGSGIGCLCANTERCTMQSHREPNITDVGAVKVGEIFYVPVRFLSEGLGLHVDWAIYRGENIRTMNVFVSNAPRNETIGQSGLTTALTPETPVETPNVSAPTGRMRWTFDGVHLTEDDYWSDEMVNGIPRWFINMCGANYVEMFRGMMRNNPHWTFFTDAGPDIPAWPGGLDPKCLALGRDNCEYIPAHPGGPRPVDHAFIASWREHAMCNCPISMMSRGIIPKYVRPLSLDRGFGADVTSEGMTREAYNQIQDNNASYGFGIELEGPGWRDETDHYMVAYWCKYQSTPYQNFRIVPR